MTRKYGWTKNVLIHQVENQTYEKTLLNQTNFDKVLPDEVRQQAKLAVKDEYIFDFFELADEHSERQLEHAILGKMEHFLRALDCQVRLPDENLSIGIILCKSKNKTIVEYALHDTNRSIGVTEYRLFNQLPKELQKQLPAPELIATF
jgi:Uncharacterized conserved protein